MQNDILIESFPFRSSDKIRYADTDRQGHVNNAVFAVLFELGRVELLCDPAAPFADPGSAFVIAKLTVDFLAELTWPGDVVIGTRVTSIGRSSIRLEQAIFQHDRCKAKGESVVVLMDEATRRSRALSFAAVETLKRLAG